MEERHAGHTQGLAWGHLLTPVLMRCIWVGPGGEAGGLARRHFGHVSEEEGHSSEDGAKEKGHLPCPHTDQVPSHTSYNRTSGPFWVPAH